MTDHNREHRIFTPGTVDMLLIAAVWLTSVAVVNPRGEFPLNDDWSFGLTVKFMLEQYEFRPVGWASMPLVSQALWGALFCLPKGFSFEMLRLSTLTLALTGIVGMYRLMTLLQCRRYIAVIATLALAFNPLYFALSHSFMTDVPFTVATIWACYFFAKYLRNDSASALAAGTAFALLATLCRQLGLAVPLAFAAALLVQGGWDKRRLMHALIPPAATMGTLYAYQGWLGATGRLPAEYHVKTVKLLNMLSTPLDAALWFVINGLIAILYYGWFTLPVLIFVIPVIRALPSGSRQTLIVKFTGFEAAVMLVAALISWGRLMPLSLNIIAASGILPVFLADGTTNIPPLSKPFWVFVTVLSIVGGAILAAVAVWQLAANVMERRSAAASEIDAVGLFLFLCPIVYLSPILVTGYFDRYLLPMLPVIAALAGSLTSKQEKSAANGHIVLTASLSLIMMLFSVGITRDYMTWNRARWDLLTDLMESNRAPVENIDGGFEHFGLYRYDPRSRGGLAGAGTGRQVLYSDRYAVTFGNMSGWTRAGEKRFTRWVGSSDGSILLLRQPAK